MSASSRRTFDTDNITLRTIFARGSNNTNIQSTLVLTADGRGGTRWTHPSSLGAYTLNYISTDNSLIQWDLSLNNVFYLNTGQGAGMRSSLTNPYQTTIYGKSYQALYDRNTGSTMKVTDNNSLYSTLNLSTTTQQFYTTLDSTTQTMYWNMNPLKFLVHPAVSSINSTMVYDLSVNPVNFDSQNSSIAFFGVRDLKLSTILEPQRGVFFSLSTFTSEGYLGMSGEISSLRGMSTTMPYHFRSTFLLNSSNAFVRQAAQQFLSTPYTAVFTVSYAGTPPIVNTTCTIRSSIGFPYTPSGFRGGNAVQSYSETIGGNVYTVSIVEDSTRSRYLGDAFVSTLSFSLDAFSTFINRNNSTSIVLSYTPSLVFTGNSTIGTSNNSLVGFSTFLNCGNEVLFSTISVDDVALFENQVPIQNLYKGVLNIEIPKSLVVARYTSTYTVQHYIPSSIGGYSNANPATWPATSYNFTRAGLSSPQVASFTPARNSAFITIIGS